MPPHTPSVRLQTLVVFAALAGCPSRPSPAETLPIGPAPAGMVTVGGGQFQPGGQMSQNGQVIMPPFFLDATEVTVAAFTSCVQAGRCSVDSGERATVQPGERCNYGVPGKENHPMNCVGWGQADLYCHAQGKRLPTEKEWDWAARSSVRLGPHPLTGNGSTPWEGAAPDLQPCWSALTPRTGTCVVGSSPAGDPPNGLHDLAGNVSEWTTHDPIVPPSRWDVFGAPAAPAPTTEPVEIVAGGNWGGTLWYQTDDGAHAQPRPVRYAWVGFRCARSASPPAP